MTRNSIATIRKAELSAAAYTALSMHGLKGTTLEAVAKIAGVSKASVLHYFESKDALLESALRQSSTMLLREAIILLKVAETPWERIHAVIEANLSPTSYNPQVAHGWVALCSEGAHSEKYKRIQNVIYQRTKSNIYSAMKLVATPYLAQTTTQLIITLIDGLWIRCSLHSEGFDRDAAREHFNLVLGSIFPNSEDRIAGQKRMAIVSASLFS